MLPKFWIAGRCLTITLLARHAHRALRERDRGDHRQELGRQADGERDGEEQRLERRRGCSAMLTTRMNSTSDDDRPQDQEAEAPQCRARTRSRAARAARRAAMSPNRVAAPVAITSACAVPLTTEVPRNTMRRVGSVASRAGVLLDRQRLAGERRLLHVEVACASSSRASAGTRSPADRRTTSPGTSSRRGISTPGAVAQHGRRRRHLEPQALGRPLRAEGLQEVERDRQQHHARDEHRVDDLAQGGRDDARHEQEQHERVGERGEDLPGRAELPARRAGLVGALRREAARGLRRGQAEQRRVCLWGRCHSPIRSSRSPLMPGGLAVVSQSPPFAAPEDDAFASVPAC